ncbi:MAG: sugar kinase [Clostridiales bacterium]|jgi:2-dehydro-3-deoxygluconokinase|nr:sugar kinase [Clostridiales bacterium]
MLMPKIVTFGEIMMHLQPPAHKRLIQADAFSACFGGSEANTAAALAQWGEAASLVTMLPDNALGDACLRRLRAMNVDTSHIIRGNGRMGLYFTEKGASQRPSQVIYDREYSAFSQMGPKEIDFERVFKGADWFHFSGITPALGNNIYNLTETAVNIARRQGLKVSCDFNFRSLLWSAGRAREIMSRLIRGIDLLVINENQAEEVLGIKTGGLHETAVELCRRFHLEKAAITRRRTLSGEVSKFSALLYEGGESFQSRTYSIFMIDKIGGGDAFSAGIIYGTLNNKSPQETVDFAAAAACCKHTIEGDMIAADLSDIEWIMHSDGRGRMIR